MVDPLIEPEVAVIGVVPTWPVLVARPCEPVELLMVATAGYLELQLTELVISAVLASL
jgi:hypothetical protein